MTDKVKILIKVTRRIDEILKMGDTGVTHLQELETLTDLQTFINSLPEEPVSEDLEEEYHEFLKREWFGKPGKTISEQMFFTAQYFAQWQKEQMMAKAIDAHVNYAWSSLSFGGFDWSKTGLGLGDKCKLIIIKEG